MKTVTQPKNCYSDNTALLDAAEEFFEALERDATDEELREIFQKIPISPENAKYAKRVYGKELMLQAGTNLALANAEFGEGWLDEPDEER